MQRALRDGARRGVEVNLERSKGRLTLRISDAPMRVTQNKFMVGARSLHLLVSRLARHDSVED